jgi:hypothetical protein
MKLYHPLPNPPPLRGRGGWGVTRINTLVLVPNTNIINIFSIPVGCVPRTHRLIGVIACLPVGRGITPYKVIKEFLMSE